MNNNLFKNILLFNALSHFFMGITYLYFNDITKKQNLFFIFGHLILSITIFMIYNSNDFYKNIDKNKFLGSFGHFLLFIYSLINIIIDNNYFILNILFLLGQSGMIYYYNNINIKFNTLFKIDNNILFFIIFFILFLYYLLIFLRIKSFLKYNYLLLCLSYFLLIIYNNS